MRVAVYKKGENLSVVYPMGGKKIEDVVKKSIPLGKPYKIIDEEELPKDKTFRDAWDIDESELVDGEGERDDSKG